MRDVTTNGEVTIYSSGTTCAPFYFSSKLEEIDLSSWHILPVQGEEYYWGSLGPLQNWFILCSNLKKVNLGDNGYLDGGNSDFESLFFQDAFNSQLEGQPPFASIPNLEDVSFVSEVDMLPGNTETDEGSYFPYDKEGGWNAYQDNKLQASGLSSYEAFRAYQKTHPGMTRYVWVGAPQPTPDPDPEPTPDPEPEPTPDAETHAGWEWTDAGWRYYTDNDSYLTDGWHWVASEAWEAHWYYFSTDGAMCTGWIWDGSWYYCNPAGDMAYGVWQWIDGAWYGFWYNGTMCTGWIWDSGYNAWFYCYNNGAMARNTWVDGYWLNNAGICLL